MFAVQGADKPIMRLSFCSALFLSLFFGGCGWAGLKETSISQFSRFASARSFTPAQKEDLAALVQDLHNYTVQGAKCNKFREALNRNQTIKDFEEAYNLNSGFIYDEFLTMQATDILKPSMKKSRAVAGQILAAWKQTATAEQIDAIILKARKCYPDHF